MIGIPKPVRKKKEKPDYKALYEEIWNERPHICVNCGYVIDRPVVHVFAHKRSKGARPDLKLDKDNIVLECSTWIRRDGQPGCHELSHCKPSLYKERKLNYGR